MYNAEPLADFIDLACIGEGEEELPELIALYRRAKAEGWDKPRFLRAAAQIEGIYVPSLYDVTYHDDGTVAGHHAPGRRPGEGAKAHHPRHGRRLLPGEVHRPLHGDRPRPGDPGAVPGLHPGLPVLPGGVRLPPGPLPQQGACW